MLLSEHIAKLIEQMLDEGDGTASVKRNDLAAQLGCVPSQVSYVISSRFTPERGYYTESRRGGGGYIRIVRVPMSRNQYLAHFFCAIGSAISEKEARAYFEQLWAEAIEIYWSTENKSSLLKFSKEMEQEISEYRKQFTQEDTMAGMIQGWLDAYKGSHVCSVQIWKEAFDHFDREPKKFETNEICSIMDTQITGWKRAGVHRFSKEGYGRQRSWIREGAEEEGGNEPDKDGFTKLTKAEQLELPFDLPDREKG